MNSFGIYRIVGNALAPRDEPWKRLDAVRRIIEAEPRFPGSGRWWCLNRILDGPYLKRVVDLLNRHGEPWFPIPPDLHAWRRARTRAHQLINLIGINRARNLCIEHGRTRFEWTWVLDGDCYFNDDGWRDFLRARSEHSRKLYYTAPSYREGMGPGEPMVCFHRDAEIRFDEYIPFGQGDKQRLLFQLGHSRIPGRSHVIDAAQPLCAAGGHVTHVTTGDVGLEQDAGRRGAARDESLTRLMASLNDPLGEGRPAKRVPSIKHGSPVLYTCITGGRDELRPIRVRTPGWFRAVAFTDDARLLREGHPDWHVRPPAHEIPGDPVRTARWHKHHPHVLFPAAGASIWIDGTCSPVAALHELYDYLDEDLPIAAFRHMVRESVAEEAGEVLRLGLDDPEVVRRQSARYAGEGFPDDLGLFSTAVLVRRHSQGLAALEEGWWGEIRDGSRRDQLSFTYALWRHGAGCATLPGYSRDVNAAPYVPHRPNPYFEVTVHGPLTWGAP